MTWDQLRVMTAAGMDVECHARVHEDLTENDDERLIWQVLGCREIIESNLGRRPLYVAFPSGIYDERVAATFASDGYWGGITTQQGVEQGLIPPLRAQAPARAQHHLNGATGRVVGVEGGVVSECQGVRVSEYQVSESRDVGW